MLANLSKAWEVSCFFSAVMNVCACHGGDFILCICEATLGSCDHKVPNVNKQGICHLNVASGVSRRDESRTGLLWLLGELLDPKLHLFSRQDA